MIVGAGPAGLATAACLNRVGITPVVLERGPRPGERWHHHYRNLHLHTVRSLSGLPGMPIPASAGRWVSRADFAAYLARYADACHCEVRTGVEVGEIRRASGGYVVETGTEPIPARTVVIATGYTRVPVIPVWGGGDQHSPPVVHSAAYADAEPYRGRRVLVVGAGNSGADIALDLARGGAAAVWLAVRDPFTVVPRQAYGLPAQVAGILLHRLPTAASDAVATAERALTIGSLAAQGLPDRRNPVFSRHRRRSALPLLDHGLTAALRAGRVRAVAAVQGMDGDQVRLADGTALRPDAVIAATGYRPGLERLVGSLGVLNHRGLPQHDLPDLHFVGFRNPLTGALREIGREARTVAGRVGTLR